MKEDSLHIGTSGWNYAHWKNNFYPADLPQKEWLSFYTKNFNTVELNSSFYHLPKKETFKKWHDNTPGDFIFSVKASRYITHIQKLVDSKESVKKFLDAAVFLKEKLGPVLFQLPPNLNYDNERLENFCKLLPENFSYTFELRNSSWWCDECYDILRSKQISFCFFELGDIISPEIFTSNLIYVRLHGPSGRYKGSYSDNLLKNWDEKFLIWLKEGYNIYCFFDNDEQGFAAKNAKSLVNLIKL